MRQPQSAHSALHTPSTPISGSTRLSMLPGATQNAVVLRGKSPNLSPFARHTERGPEEDDDPAPDSPLSFLLESPHARVLDGRSASPSTRRSGSASPARRSRLKPPPPPPRHPIPMSRSIVATGKRPQFDATHSILATAERHHRRKYAKRRRRKRHPVPPLATEPGGTGRKPKSWWGNKKEAALRKSLAAARDRALPRLVRRVDEELSAAKKMLPLNDVVAGSARLAAALELLSTTFRKAVLGHTGRAIQLWKEDVKRKKRLMRHRAATHIERIARGRKGRRRARARLRKRSAAVHTEATRYWRRWRRQSIVRVRASAKMQAKIRAVRERKIFLRLSGAANRIQGWLRCLHAMSYTALARRTRAARLAAASLVQRAFRGYLTRRDVVSVARLQKDLLSADREAANFEAMLKLHFTQLGACLTLQKWWPVAIVKHRAEKRGRMFIGHAMAMQIQRRYRGRKGRALAKVCSLGRRGEMQVVKLEWHLTKVYGSAADRSASVDNAAAKVQALVRGKLGQRVAGQRRVERAAAKQRRAAKKAEQLEASAQKSTRESVRSSISSLGRSLKRGLAGGLLADRGEKDAALLVQKQWRRVLARREVKAIRYARKLVWVNGRRDAALRLQARWRETMRSRREHEAACAAGALYIQRVWRGHTCRVFEVHRASYLAVCVDIQCAYRVLVARRVKNMLAAAWQLKMRSSTTVQRIVRGYIGRHLAWARREGLIVHDEVASLGWRISMHTASRLSCGFVMNALHKRSADSFAEGTVQALFWSWVAKNDGSREHGVEGRITGNQFTKMMRAVPGMLAQPKGTPRGEGGKGKKKRGAKKKKSVKKKKSRLAGDSGVVVDALAPALTPGGAGASANTGVITAAVGPKAEEDAPAIDDLEVEIVVHADAGGADGADVDAAAAAITSALGITALESPEPIVFPSQLASPRAAVSLGSQSQPLTTDGADSAKMRKMRREEKRAKEALEAAALLERQQKHGAPLMLNRPEQIFAKACDGNAQSGMSFRYFTRALQIMADERLFTLDEDPEVRQDRVAAEKKARAKKKKAAKARKEKELAAALEKAQMAAEYAGEEVPQSLDDIAEGSAAAVALTAQPGTPRANALAKTKRRATNIIGCNGGTLKAPLSVETDTATEAGGLATPRAAALEQRGDVETPGRKRAGSTGAGLGGKAKKKALRADTVETHYKKHRGNDARVLYLIDNFLLEAKWAKMHKARRWEPADHIIDGAVLKIQRVRRNCHARRIIGRLHGVYDLMMAHILKERMVAKMQAMWRRKKARDFLCTLAMSVYTKTVDPESGVPFYTNKLTGEMMWEKPLSFGAKGDVEVGYELAQAVKVEQGPVKCFRCKEAQAVKLCVQCAKPYCIPCHIDRHKKKGRELHEWLPVATCSECENPAVRQCTAEGCGDAFCDGCWDLFHWRGPLARHAWEPVIPQCESCNSARPTRKYKPYGEQALCIPCFEYNYAGSDFDLIHFDSCARHAHLDAAEEAKEAARLEKEAALEAERAQIRAAILVASIVRMIIVRIKLGPKVDAARQKVRDEYAEQEKLAMSFSYRMKKKLQVQNAAQRMKKEAAKKAKAKAKVEAEAAKAVAASGAEVKVVDAKAAAALAGSKTADDKAASKTAKKGGLLGKLSLIKLGKKKLTKEEAAAAKNAAGAESVASAAAAGIGSANASADAVAAAPAASAAQPVAGAAAAGPLTVVTWTSYFDETSAASYYYNAVDGTTTWDWPSGPNDTVVDEFGASVAYSPATSGSEAYATDEYATDEYGATNTGAEYSDASGYGSDYASDGYATGEDEGDSEWIQYFDEEGNAYMSSTLTGEYYYV